MYQRTSYQAYNNSPKAHTISALDTDSIEQAAQLCNQHQTICVELFFLQAVQHCIVYARAARRSRWRLPPRHPIELPICRRIFCAPVVTRAVITIHRPAVWRRFRLHFALPMPTPRGSAVWWRGGGDQVRLTPIKKSAAARPCRADKEGRPIKKAAHH